MAVCTTRKKTVIRKEKISFKGRSYKNYNVIDFQQSMINHNWEEFFRGSDPNVLWQFIHEAIRAYIDPMCPMKEFKVLKAREPWITNEILEAIKDKDRLLNKARRTKSEADWYIAKAARNRVGRDVELLRIDYLKDQQNQHRADPKKFWKTVASIVPGKKGSTGDIWLKDGGTGARIDRDKTAGEMNTFFTNVGRDLAKQHTSRWSYFGETEANSLEYIQTESDEVVKLCKGIETMKSSGFDDISARICKDAFLVISDQLVHLFNCSLWKAFFLTHGRQPRLSQFLREGTGNMSAITGPYHFCHYPANSLRI